MSLFLTKILFVLVFLCLITVRTTLDIAWHAFVRQKTWENHPSLNCDIENLRASLTDFTKQARLCTEYLTASYLQ